MGGGVTNLWCWSLCVVRRIAWYCRFLELIRRFLREYIIGNILCLIVCVLTESSRHGGELHAYLVAAGILCGMNCLISASRLSQNRWSRGLCEDISIKERAKIRKKIFLDMGVMVMGSGSRVSLLIKDTMIQFILDGLEKIRGWGVTNLWRWSLVAVCRIA